jgi:uncharacterized SAM-binding protein YcdF (DUF218 family)
MQQIEGFVVILGSPNDLLGNLTQMGQRRVAKGYAEYLRLRSVGWKILLTGGFGTHFNPTDKPHAFYARQLLLAWGVPPTDIVEFAESRHTVEDAILSYKIVERYAVKNLLVVSSDFHMPRVKFIFAEIFADINLSFAAAEHLAFCSVEEQKLLLEHEAHALENLHATHPSWH